MDIDISKEVLSLGLQFYARALTYPYDELTYEFQHLFREMEKLVESDADNTIANRVLDVLNFYQGEEMMTLQSEFVRMFTPREGDAAPIPLFLADLDQAVPIEELLAELETEGLNAETEEDPELVLFVLEYFAGMLSYANDEHIVFFYSTYLKNALERLAGDVYNFGNINFYKELGKGLHELVKLVD